jgi:hypothetical protein
MSECLTSIFFVNSRRLNQNKIEKEGLQLKIQRLRKEMEQIKWERLREEQQRIGFDPYCQQQYMERMTAIRDEANQRRYAQLAEADQRQKEAQEVAIKERLAKNKQYQQHLERIEPRKQKEIRKLGVYFTTSQEQFESMIADTKIQRTHLLHILSKDQIMARVGLADYTDIKK